MTAEGRRGSLVRLSWLVMLAASVYLFSQSILSYNPFMVLFGSLPGLFTWTSLAYDIVLIFASLSGYRRGERWAWWVFLIALIALVLSIPGETWTNCAHDEPCLFVGIPYSTLIPAAAIALGLALPYRKFFSKE